MRACITVLLLVSLTARAPQAQSAQAQTAETPEQVTDRFIAAMRTGDWNGMASLMHQNALKEMRQLLAGVFRSEEHTSELQSPVHLVCRLLLEKKKKKNK